MARIIVIGSGIAGMAAASRLAAAGNQVTILEKNSTGGGRAGVWKKEGFTFDMGPSWYWMPDVFDTFFASFGKKTADYYTLQRLDPSYQVIFKDNTVALPAGVEGLKTLFESIEQGAGQSLERFLLQAREKYDIGMGEFVWKPSVSVGEYLDLRLLGKVFKTDMYKAFSKHVRKFFSDPQILKILEFPVLFLGATPQNTPALYSLMNYAEMALGTWYPMGGMGKIPKALEKLALDNGVKVVFNAEVTGFEIQNRKVVSVKTKSDTYNCDAVLSTADYRHTDTLLCENANYTDKYWESRVLAPSALVFYLGINQKLAKLEHHNLFFDEEFELHAKEIYEAPQWPSKPLFYVCAPSKTDPSVAPENMENIFVLVPIAPNLEDTEELREKYYKILMQRLGKYCGVDIEETVVVKRSYAVNDFKADYHAYKGNAYGLANTLQQTAIFKPKLRHKKIKNMYFAGQLTVPGPGVPPALVSGMVAADYICKS